MNCSHPSRFCFWTALQLWSEIREIFVVLKECFGISCPAICPQNSADDSLAFTSICYWAKTFIPSASCEVPLCIFSEAEPVLMWKNKQVVGSSSESKFSKALMLNSLWARGHVFTEAFAHINHCLLTSGTHKEHAAGHTAYVCFNYWLQRALQVSLRKFLCNQETQNLTEYFADIPLYLLTIRLTVACHFLTKFLQSCTRGIIKRGAFHSWEVEKIFPHPRWYLFTSLYL